MDAVGPREGTRNRELTDASFYLPVVLWSLLFASLLVISYLAASRTSIRIAYSGHPAASSLADAGISVAVLDIVEAMRGSGRGRRIPGNGTPVVCRMPDGVRIVIAIEDEGGKIDLNRADGVLLGYLLAGIGHSPGDANKLADRILDYRDADELRCLNGAEWEEYRRAAPPPRRTGGCTLSVEEVAEVLGIPLQIVREAHRDPVLAESPHEHEIDVGEDADEHEEDGEAYGETKSEIGVSEMSAERAQVPEG